MTVDTRPAQLVAWLKAAPNNYRDARVLPDGSVAATFDLLYTRAIVLGCSYDGFESRFCFADRALADQRFSELRSEDDVPPGAIARRGVAADRMRAIDAGDADTEGGSHD